MAKVPIRKFRRDLAMYLRRLQAGEIIDLPYISLMMYVPDEEPAPIDDFEDPENIENTDQILDDLRPDQG